MVDILEVFGVVWYGIREGFGALIELIVVIAWWQNVVIRR